ncbi:MAG TPA: hypothetical protein VM030_04760 [Acidimicrobiales bacterium]|nr:hypothetical protein [Acidimicrobiales bacterium]
MGTFGRLYVLFLRLQATRGRMIGMLALGAVAVLVGLAMALSDARDLDPTVGRDLVDGFGLGIVAPVISLIVASSALGDLVDDNTLVYVWLRPVARWQLAVAAAASTLTLTLPLVLIPVIGQAALVDKGYGLVGAAAAAAAIATVAYGCVFVGLGFKVRRSLVWGLAYVLIWENAVARVASGAARISIQSYATSLLHRMSEGAPPLFAPPRTSSVVVPLVVSAVALALTARWLRRTEVA